MSLIDPNNRPTRARRSDGLLLVGLCITSASVMAGLMWTIFLILH